MSISHVRATPASSAYDAVAEEYDSQLAADYWMRRRQWRIYDGAFRAGQRVLDAGCGTGIDAAHLARRGILVTAIDASPAMIALARHRAEADGVADLVEVRQLDFGEIAGLPVQQFDGIISAFAGLNTLPTMESFAAAAADLLRPKGRLIVHLLGPGNAWEWVSLVLQLGWQAAAERRRQAERQLGIGGQPVRHYVLRAGEAYERDFAQRFRLVRVVGAGIARPPGPRRWLPGHRMPAMDRLDDVLGRARPLVDWSSFYVLELERRD